MKKWIIALLVLIVLGGAGFLVFGRTGKLRVLVANPERREAIRAVYATGTVKAEQIARLRPELGGEVTQVAVKVGEEVRQGALVMELALKEQQAAAREQAARVQEYNMDMEEKRSVYLRDTTLLAQGGVTPQQVTEAKAAYDRSLASLRTVQATLSTQKTEASKGRINSPINGVVTRVNVSAGDIVPPNMEAVTILDPASFKVYADIDELDINRVQPGMQAIVAFDAMPDRRFNARVERVIPQTDEVTKTIPVVLNLIDFVPNLSDGLTATVNVIEERRPNSITIPASALLREKNGSAFVWVVGDHNKLEQRKVKLGVRGDQYVEIEDGIHEDEMVALNPDENWVAGKEVTVEHARQQPRAN